MNASAIELTGLSLARAGRTILHDVNASVALGEFIGVFGPNGSGKSTLLHAILGLLRPVAGEVRVLGQTPTRGNRAAGYLPQHRSPVGDLRLRARDFVSSALDGERWGLPLLGRSGRDEVDWAIETVEAGDIADRPLRELSGGQVQRLLLAQALLGRPKLLLLDEPLISLDPRFQRAVVELVRRVQRSHGITVLFTAHDLNPLIGAMDRVLYLGQGGAALGTVAEVIRDEVLTRIYGTPIEVVHIRDRILVITSQGIVEAEGYRHDV